MYQQDGFVAEWVKSLYFQSRGPWFDSSTVHLFLLRIPNGKRKWFWYKTAPAPAADANELRIRKQYQNSSYSPQSGPISNIVWTD